MRKSFSVEQFPTNLEEYISLKTKFYNINALTLQLFEPQIILLIREINRITLKNYEISKVSPNFYFAGEAVKSFEERFNNRGYTFVSSPEIAAETNTLFSTLWKVKEDKYQIMQFLSLCYSNIKTYQNFRDCTPDSIVSLDSVLRKIPRLLSFEEKRYSDILEKIDFYASLKLMV